MRAAIVVALVAVTACAVPGEEATPEAQDEEEDSLAECLPHDEPLNVDGAAGQPTRATLEAVTVQEADPGWEIGMVVRNSAEPGTFAIRACDNQCRCEIADEMTIDHGSARTISLIFEEMIDRPVIVMALSRYGTGTPRYTALVDLSE